MRVLVTGHRGYIGSVLTRMLRNAHCDVIGLDADWYSAADFGRVSESVPAYEKDVREVEVTDLLSFDAVIHLAGLPDSGDLPVNSRTVDEINHHATARLIDCARKADVSRFIFFSSASVYGRQVGAPVTEVTTPRPSSPTARAKLMAECDLLSATGPHFHTTVLRIPEVYGMSPRMRLDQVVNDLVASAATHGRVSLNHESAAWGATGWRSLVALEDLGRVVLALLNAEFARVSGRVFNVAAPDQHYRIVDIADQITELLPLCTRSPAGELHDPNSLRMDGSRLLSTFPNLRMNWTLEQGIRQLHAAFTAGGLAPSDWRGHRLRRAEWLHDMRRDGQLDDALRTRGSVAA